ncbi:MAG: hypothetical protein J0I20_19315 [Chloroflexi bacterium]|nr:hypothetical protein [Chloroflexota bacterium]OJW06223.1 MAG: hypothetical protein BGO39_25595 [Chloroflexi bacterium 54-19]
MFKNLRPIPKLLAGLVIFVCLVLTLVACGDEGTTPVLTPGAVPSIGPFPSANIESVKKQWEASLNQSRQKWEAKNITSYDLQLAFTDTSWKPITLFHVTLKDNQVVEHTRQLISSFAGPELTPGPVETNVLAAGYTVPGLFDLAQSLVESNWTEGETIFKIQFDSEYYFPSKIYLDNEHYTDLQKVWEVKMFKPL